MFYVEHKEECVDRLEMYKILKHNMDEDGLIGHIDKGRFNGADSCQRTMTYHIFNHLLTPEPRWLGCLNALAMFTTPLGYIRHPSLGYHCGLPGYSDHACWSDPTNFSGDQARALIVACQFHGFVYPVRDISWDTLKNFSRFPNGDACFLAEWGALIRGMQAWFLWPLLFVCDAWLCITNLVTVIKYYVSVVNSNLTGSFIITDGYINGLLLSLSTREMPTPFGWLARKIIRIKLQDAWDYYFRHEGAPQLNLFIPKIKEKL